MMKVLFLALASAFVLASLTGAACASPVLNEVSYATLPLSLNHACAPVRWLTFPMM
jgi:hypothetical protein